MNLKNTPNVTSFPVSVDGHAPCNSLDGQQTELFGREAALANHSQAQAIKKENQTNATSGPYGSTSYASAALQQSLESKLAHLLPMGGLTMFIKGWKRKVTPAGRQFCHLAVSVRPISETDCSLWPTPRSTDGDKATRTQEGAEREFARNKGPCLATTAKAMWPTPREFMHKDAKTDRGKSNIGEIVHGLTAPTENKGSLNPQFVCWLMGYPTEWESCAGMVTLLSQRLPRNL